MDDLEKVETIRTKCNVSYTDAKAALDAADGNVLDTIIWLESQGKTQTTSAHAATEPESVDEPSALVLQLERHKAGEFLLVFYDQDSCHTCPHLRLLVVVQILLDAVRGVGGVIHQVVDTAGHVAVAIDAVTHAKEQAKQH